MKKQFVVRTQHAGVFFGEIKERNGQEITMINARRLWRWEGATECIGLAKYGTVNPRGCKFTAYVDEIILIGVIEMIPCTEQAAKSLGEVEEWKA